MRIFLVSAIVGLALTISASANAQVPAGATGECKDGTYTTAESKSGACSGHGGVKNWTGDKAPAKTSAAPATATPTKAAATTTPATSAPNGSTGQCKDGTYTTAESKSGACSGHGGVKNWTGDKASAKSASTTVAPAAATARAPTQAPATPPAPASSAKSTSAPMSVAPAAGGGPGKVWVNTNSKVYHCPGDQYYGKTKAGEYMTESAAKAAGNHADHGKACS